MGLLVAEGDVFWKSPTVYDVAGLVGLVLGIGSIWLALRLARLQLQADLKKAASEAIDSIQYDLLGRELGDGIRYLRDAVASMGIREWDRGLIRMEDGVAVVARLAQNLKVHETERVALIGCIARIQEIALLVREHKQSNRQRGYLSAEKLHTIGEVLLELERLRGRIANNP